MWNYCMLLVVFFIHGSEGIYLGSRMIRRNLADFFKQVVRTRRVDANFQEYASISPSTMGIIPQEMRIIWFYWNILCAFYFSQMRAVRPIRGKLENFFFEKCLKYQKNNKIEHNWNCSHSIIVREARKLAEVIFSIAWRAT